MTTTGGAKIDTPTDDTPQVGTTAAFVLTQGAETIEASDRAEAVAMAKKMSAESRQRVAVSSSDGMVKMQFRDGSLETLAIQTRRD